MVDIWIIIGIIVSLIGIFLAIPPIIKNYREKKKNKLKFSNLRKTADELFSQDKYHEALEIYKDLINQFEFEKLVDLFSIGEIYSKMGHCVLNDPQNKKNYDKILEGKQYFNNALSYFDITKYKFKNLIFRFINRVDLSKTFKLICDILKINRDKTVIKILDFVKVCKYNFRYAGTRIDLGVAYCRLAEIKNGVEYFEKAVKEYKEAIKTYPFERFPIDNVRASENLIHTYHHLASLDNPDYFIAAQTLAKEVYIKTEKRPELFEPQEGTIEFAYTAFGAGNLSREIFELNPSSNESPKILKAAIFCYEKALEFFYIEKYPYENAMIQNNIGITYHHLSHFEEPNTNLKESLNHLLNALEIRKKEQYPIDYSQTSHNLGLTYTSIALHESNNEIKIARMRDAIQQFDNALQKRPISNYPIEFAGTQLNRAITFIRFSDISEPNENLIHASDAINESQKIFTQEKYPKKYEVLEHLRRIIDEKNCKK